MTRHFDLAETAELPTPSQRQTEAPKASAFGDWDLRRDSIVRQGESVVSPVDVSKHHLLTKMSWKHHHSLKTVNRDGF